MVGKCIKVNSNNIIAYWVYYTTYILKRAYATMVSLYKNFQPPFKTKQWRIYQMAMNCTNFSHLNRHIRTVHLRKKCNLSFFSSLFSIFSFAGKIILLFQMWQYEAFVDFELDKGEKPLNDIYKQTNQQTN